MPTLPSRLPGGPDPQSWLWAAFLLLYPAATLVVRGGASALLLAASLGAVYSLTFSRSLPDSVQDASARPAVGFCFAMAAPLCAVTLSELWHRQLTLSAFDSPARFLAAVPLFLALRKAPAATLRWADLSFGVGAMAALGVSVFASRDWGDGRLGSTFLNPIHFGAIALVLGVLSALSLNWWGKDPLAIRLFKLAGLAAGLLASLQTGARGGWLAIPVIVVVLACVPQERTGRGWRKVLPFAALAIALACYLASPAVRERIHMIWSDLSQFGQGHKDTSIGIRLQIYQAVLSLIPRDPVFGLGADGLAASLQSLVDTGRMTPIAAQFGRGEAHNQMLAYVASFGILGGLALAALYLMPAALFWNFRAAPPRRAARAALMGVVFVVAFVTFGLTVETFNLKMTASFYATVIAVLAAIASHNAPSVASAAGRSSQ